jgi:hypothetical protein
VFPHDPQMRVPVEKKVSDTDGTTRTGVLVAGPHIRPPVEAFPERMLGGRESPTGGNHLAEANKSAKSSPAGSASQRPSTSDRTPVRLAAPTEVGRSHFTEHDVQQAVAATQASGF